MVFVEFYKKLNMKILTNEELSNMNQVMGTIGLLIVIENS